MRSGSIAAAIVLGLLVPASARAAGPDSAAVDSANAPRPRPRVAAPT